MDYQSNSVAVVKYSRRLNYYKRDIAMFSVVMFLVLAPLPLIFPLIGGQMSPIVVCFLIVFSFLSYLFLVFAITSYVKSKHSNLILTPSGIKLPYRPFFHAQQLAWSQIKEIRVSTKGQQRILELVVAGRNPIKLEIDYLTYENLDKLVSALSLWGLKWTKHDSFLALVTEVTNNRHEIDDSSYTALWLEEARRRISTTPFKPLTPGELLQDGRLKIIQVHTLGGWSAIYLCQFSNKTAILKESVIPDNSNEEIKTKACELFKREAQVLALVKHPGIVSIYDYFEENRRQYLVLEHINGVTLRNYVKDKGAVNRKLALRWLLEVANIVSYLHHLEPSIIHKDLTPENLVLNLSGSLVLIDFGSSNQFLGTVTGTLVGKPSYISYEQFAGKPTLQSDLYSLGAIFYFLLSGEDPKPFASNNLREKTLAYDEDIHKFLARAMAVKLSDRFANIDEFCDGVKKLMH